MESHAPHTSDLMLTAQRSPASACARRTPCQHAEADVGATPITPVLCCARVLAAGPDRRQIARRVGAGLSWRQNSRSRRSGRRIHGVGQMSALRYLHPCRRRRLSSAAGTAARPSKQPPSERRHGAENGTVLHRNSQIPGNGDFLPKFLPKQARQLSREVISPGHSRKPERPSRVCHQPSKPLHPLGGWSPRRENRGPLRAVAGRGCCRAVARVWVGCGGGVRGWVGAARDVGSDWDANPFPSLALGS